MYFVRLFYSKYFCRRFCLKSLNFFISFSLFSAQLSADVYAVGVLHEQVNTSAGLIKIDGTTNTGVDNAQNGVPVINIATPNGGGTSHNRFLDYNVGVEGLILNNSKIVNTSQLGGVLYANPNLAQSNAANKIINEITSNRTSILNGFTEVFGQKADVFVFNPNGMTCNGCGFINSERVTLGTGRPTFNAGDLAGLDIDSAAKITIGALGLNAEHVDYFDIITRFAEIKGNIYGAVDGDENGKVAELSIKTGNGSYDFTTGKISSTASDDVNKPTDSIILDSAALGGMYAGRIFLEASEKGVGVNLGGVVMATLDDLTINSEGRIIVKDVSAQRDVTLASANDDVTVTENAFSTRNLDLSAKNIYFSNANLQANGTSFFTAEQVNLTNSNFDSYGQTNFTAQDLSIDATSNFRNYANFVATDLANITNGGLFRAEGNNQITLSGTLENSGDFIVVGNAEITANTLNNLTSTVIFVSGGNLNITSNLVKNEGVIEGANLTLTTNSLIDSATATLKGLQNLTVDLGANDYVVRGVINSNEKTLVTAKSLINHGVIKSFKDVDLQLSGNLLNVYEISSSRLLNISAVNLVNFANILAKGDLTVNSSNWYNYGTIWSANDFTVTAESLVDDTNSHLLSKKTLTIDLGSNDYLVKGEVNSDEKTFIIAKNLENRGNIKSVGDVDLQLSGDLTNRKTLESGGNMVLNSRHINNWGGIWSDQNLTIYSDIITGDETSKITAIKELKLYSDNDLAIILGELNSNEKTFVTAKNLDNRGNIKSVGDVDLQLSGDLTNHGKISSSRLLNISAVNLTNYANILAKGDLTVNSSNWYNYGTIWSANDFTVTAESLVDDANAHLLSSKNLTVDLGANDYTVLGELNSSEKTLVKARNLINHGVIKSFKDVDSQLSGDVDLQLSGDVDLQLSGDVDLQLSGDLTNHGEISAATLLNISSVNFSNYANILAGGDLHFDILGNLTNKSGAQIYGGVVDVFAANIIENMNGGKIIADGDLRIGNVDSEGNFIATNRIYNRGDLWSGNDLLVKSVEGIWDDVASGQDKASFMAIRDVDIDVGTSNDLLLSNITAGRDVRFKAANLDNRSNIKAGRDVNLQIDRNIVNHGEVLAGQDLRIDDWSVVNHNLLSSGRDLAMNIINASNHGSIVAGRNATIKGDRVYNYNNALIYGAGDVSMLLNSHTYNDRGYILAGGNMKFGAAAGGASRTGTVDNIAGEINAGGDITINANSFNNIGRDNWGVVAPAAGTYWKVSYSPFAGGVYHGNPGPSGAHGVVHYIGNTNANNIARGNGYYIVTDRLLTGTTCWGCWLVYAQERAVSTLTTDRAEIIAGNDLTLNVGSGRNRGGYIYAKRDIAINANDFTNTQTAFTSPTLQQFRWTLDGWYWTAYLWAGQTYRHTLYSTVPTVIEAGRNVNIAVGNFIQNNNAGYAGSVASAHSQKQYDVAIDKSINDISISPIDTGQISFTSSFTIPDAGSNGLFKLNPLLVPELGGDSDLLKSTPETPKDGDPKNSPIKPPPLGISYVVESRIQFLETQGFPNLPYWIERLGYDPKLINTRIIGDTEAITREIAKNDVVRQIAQMQDNGTQESTIETTKRLFGNTLEVDVKSLGLELGDELTPEQQAALTEDIIWLVKETMMIDGVEEEVLVPKVYLSGKTVAELRANRGLSKGVIIQAGNDINIDAEKEVISDGGAFIAGNNININSSGSVMFQDAQIKSGGVTNIFGQDSVDIREVLRAATSTSSTPLLQALGIKDDAIAARAAAAFNAGTDLRIGSAGDINVATNYLQAGGSIFIDALGSITNNNKIINAGDDVIMTATNIYNNRRITDTASPEIIATNMVSLNATNDIENIGGKIKAGELLYMTAGNNITNAALISTQVNGVEVSNAEADVSNANNIRSSLVAQGELISDGNIVLVAGNNINNVASKITTTGLNNSVEGSAYLEATNGDVNIVTDTLRDRTVTSWYSKKNRGVSISDTTTNIASDIDIANNLTLVSGANTNIKGSDLSAGGSLTTDSTGDLNIESVQDTNYQFTANYKRGSFGRRSSSTSESTKVTNVASNINVVGDINSTSQEDINIIASNLTTQNGSVNLIAKEKVNIISGQDTYSLATTSKKHGVTTIAKNDKTHKTITQITSDLNANNGNILLSSGGNTTIIASNISSGNDTDIKVGSYIDASNNETINNEATLNILSAMDSEYDYEYSSKLGMDAGAIAVGIVAGAATGGIVGAVAGAYVGSQAQQGNIDMVETYDETIVASNITSGNNINIEVASDALIRSSELNSGNDVNIRVGSIADKDNYIINTNSNANLSITSAEEQHIRNESHEKIKPDLVAVAGAAALSGAMISSGGVLMVAGGISVAKASEDNALANRDMSESRLNKVDQISSDILTENDLNAISANNINIVASNVASNSGDLNLTSGGETNILSAIETSTLTTREEHQDFSDFSAGVDRGRAGVGVNANISKETNSTTESTVKSSNIAANNININSTSDITIQASNIAANNNVDITSANGDVNLVSATNNIKNTQVKEELDATLSVGVGNAYVDTAYAVDDAAKAGEALKDAKEELSHMKNLHNQGRATDEAVKDSEISLALATVNFSIAAKLAAASAISAAGAASTSLGTGFYGDVRMDMSGTKTKTNESIVQNVASSIVAGNNVDLTSTNKDINQKGSHIASINGDVTYTAGRDVNIEASKDTYDYKFGSETVNASVTLASSNPASMVVDNLAGSLGYQKTDQAINSITYNNSTTTANNININSGNDITAKGVNILASKDLIINAGNDLIIESKQNEYHAKGSSKGLNIGAGKNNNTGKGNYSFGLNRSKSRTDKVWVDDQTTLVANNAVSITTNNNTDIKGALIANIKADGTDGGNLNITTSTLTFEDIQDIESHYQKSLSGNLAIGRSEEQKLPNGVKNVQYGVNLHDTKVTFENNGYEKQQITRATIGSGIINITDSSNSSDLLLLNRDILLAQEITKDTITGNLKGEVSLETVVEAGKLAYQAGKVAYTVSPLGVSEMIEGYTGQQLSWKKGDVARFKEKGKEYETSVEGGNTIGMANVIPTDPSDKDYKSERLYLIGQPLSFDPDGYKPGKAYEGGLVSNVTNPIPGFNSMSVMHDKITEGTFLGKPGLLQLSIVPSIPVNYYGLVGKTIRNIYEKPTNNKK